MTTVGSMLKMLCTVLAMALRVLVMVKLLPSLTAVLGMENSVSEPSLSVLTQVMVGRGCPLAVQLRERASGLSSCTGLLGDMVMEGATVKIMGTESKHFTSVQPLAYNSLRVCIL